MSRTICFIDKEGMIGTCSEEASGKDTVDCRKCSFYKKFKGKEEKEFSYCEWRGEINKVDKKLVNKFNRSLEDIKHGRIKKWKGRDSF